MFSPFTGTSIINYCLLQPMLHVNHPLLQFANIMDPLLSTAALLFHTYSHRVQIWAVKAAWYLARWRRSHTQSAVITKSAAIAIFMFLKVV